MSDDDLPPRSFAKDIGRTYTVRDDVRVTLEAALGVTVGLLVASKVPDDQRLVATAREQHVGAKV